MSSASSMPSEFKRQRRHMCSEIRRFRRSTFTVTENVLKDIDLEQVYRDAFLRAAQKDAKKVSEEPKKDVVVIGKYMRYYSTESIHKYYASTGSTKFVDEFYMSWARSENAKVSTEIAKASFVWRGLPTF